MKILKRFAAAALAVCVMMCCCAKVYATGSSTTTRSSNTSSDPDANVPEVTVSSNDQETLGTVGFVQNNTTRILVGKSTTLYLMIKDMGYSFYTTFESSDESIATVEQIDNRAVKVVGIKSGVVTITATVDSTKGVKVAKYELTVAEAGDAPASTPAVDQQVESNVNNAGGIETDYNDNNNDLDLYSSTDDPMLLAYAQQRSSSNATSLLLGLIGWVIIIIGGVYVFSVIIRSRTPKMNISPGSRKRYSTGGSSSMHAGNRLLPNKYYRNLKKY